MPDLEHARLMLHTARRDLRALAVMQDPDAVDAEVFGFHAQQAVEKALKAWICLTGEAYPRVHDLEALRVILEEQGLEVPERFRRLEWLADFAVEFRYGAFGSLEHEIDRPALTQDVQQLVEHVEWLGRDSESAL